MRNTLETRLGLFFGMTLLALVFVFQIIGGAGLFHHGLTIQARFNSVLELKEGDPVRMAGVDIGQVKSITLATNRVVVTMKLLKPENVKTDSKASVKFAGLLGQNYVAVDFGSGPAPVVVDGAILETTEQVDLSSIMVKLDNVAQGIDNLTKSFTGDGLNNILGPFVDFLHENSPRISAILENLRTTTTEIAQGQGTVGKLIADDKLYTLSLETVDKLNSAADDAKLTLADAKAAVSQLNAGEGTLGKLLKDPTLYSETTAAMGSLKEILQKVNQGQGSVGKVVNDETLYRDAKLTLQKVSQATEGLEDQGPLSILSTVINTLF